MSLLTICQELAYDVGLESPTQVVGDAGREWSEAVSFSKAALDELARRGDWGALHRTVTLLGDGTNKTFDLGLYHDRLTPSLAVTYGGAIVRPLTRAEWAGLTPLAGPPRYFLLEGRDITFWPYLNDGDDVLVSTQTNAWCSNGTDCWTADDETSLIDESLAAQGLIVRWRRQKGMDYADREAEYEAALAQIAGFEDGSRL